MAKFLTPIETIYPQKYTSHKVKDKKLNINFDGIEVEIPVDKLMMLVADVYKEAIL